MKNGRRRVVLAALAAAVWLTVPSACTEVEDGDLLYALTGERPEDTKGSSSSGGGGGVGCESGTTVYCVSRCDGEGYKTCDDWGEWGPCEPVEEICGNMQDDDCDGSIDEGCNEPAKKGYFEGCISSTECDEDLDCLPSGEVEPSYWCSSPCNFDTDCPDSAHCDNYCREGGGGRG